MILLTLMIAVLIGVALTFRHYASVRYKTSPLKIKSKTMQKIISVKPSGMTLEVAMSKCPLLNFHPLDSIANMLKNWNKVSYKDGEIITTPGFVLRGEVEIFRNNRLLCVKGKGSLLNGAMELLGLTGVGTKKSRGPVDVLSIDVTPVKEKVSYVVFSILRKCCVEIACNYFELQHKFIERETIKICSNGDNLNSFVSMLNDTLFLNLSLEGKEVLKASVETRFVKEAELFKEKGENMEYVLFIAEGSIAVSSNDNEFGFGCGSVFGYFALFFDCYSSVRIRTKSDSVFYLCRSFILSRFGLDESKFNYSTLEGMDEMLRAIDEAAEWMRLSPGDILAQKGDMAREVFYISAGNVKTASKEFSSGMAMGGRECVLGECWDETAIAIKITDVVRIPSLLLDYIFGGEMKFFKKYAKRLFENDKKRNGKIVSIVPTGKYKDITLFSKRLKAAAGSSSLLLSRKDVVDVLAKKAFDTTEELRFMDYLTRMSKRCDIVLICVENGYSRLLKYLLNFSDVLLVVGTSFTDLPEYNTYCSIELVKIYEERKASKNIFGKKKKAEQSMGNVYGRKGEPVQYDRVHHVLSPSRTVLFCSKDFQRLGRSLLGRRIGLVLGGGGARGLAHIGVIQALEEAGIPIDCIGGTSMGAFIGALYAKECNNYYVFKYAKKFSGKVSNIWLLLLDLTYPICSMFSGYTFNSSLYSIFKDELIQDLWLEYFCVTTNLATYEEEIHRNGILWRYVRASMGICGYLPPICDNKKLLVDGGYLNNVPADVMMGMQVEKIITVDVGTILDNDYFDYGDTLSGFTVLFNKFFGNKKFVTMEDIQYRLAYISTEKKMREIGANNSIIMLKPDLGKYKTVDFKRFDEIVACGYQSTKKTIQEWKRNGMFDKFFPGLTKQTPRRRYSV